MGCSRGVGPLGGVSSGCEQFRGWLRVVEGVMPLGIGDGSCQDIGDTSVGPGVALVV